MSIDKSVVRDIQHLESCVVKAEEAQRVAEDYAREQEKAIDELDQHIKSLQSELVTKAAEKEDLRAAFESLAIQNRDLTLTKEVLTAEHMTAENRVTQLMEQLAVLAEEKDSIEREYHKVFGNVKALSELAKVTAKEIGVV